VAGLQHRRLLGERIRTSRKRIGYSQELLAEKSDLTAKYLGEVERGCVNISLDALFRIAKAVKVKVSDLTQDF
jgi:transcriptional regulator with XRE-family HTH domain